MLTVRVLCRRMVRFTVLKYLFSPAFKFCQELRCARVFLKACLRQAGRCRHLGQRQDVSSPSFLGYFLLQPRDGDLSKVIDL